MEQKEKKTSLPLATPLTPTTSMSGSSSVARVLTQLEQKQTVDKKETQGTVSKPDTKEKPSSTPSLLTRSVSLLSDEDKFRRYTAWQKALTDIAELAQERKLKKKVFISYAWLAPGSERDELQQWLKRLQDDLQRAGITVFLELRDMQGHLDTTMQQHLEHSDFVMPILTPKFLERAQDSSTNLAFEFRLTLKKAETNPASVLPILRSGTFPEVVKGPLAPLIKHGIYMGQKEVRLEPLLSSVSDPLGLIPVIYGIRIGDKAYADILQEWRNNGLTRLPTGSSGTVQRTALLEQLHQGFQQSDQKYMPPIQVIQGMERVDRTQLATQYANCYRSNEGFIRWIYADSSNLETEWQRFGELLGLDLKGLEPTEQRCLIRQELQTRPKWMLILDNLENMDDLAELLPEKLTPHQQVLITTHSKNWGQLPVLTVDEFTAQESFLYFKERLTPEESKGAKELAQRLGHLRLALSHVVAYIEQTGINAQQYLEHYQKVGEALLDREIKGSTSNKSYSHTVLTTCSIAIQALEKADSKAAEVVRCCAYLHPEGIEARFLQEALNIDELDIDDYMVVIREYGLLTREGSRFKMHRLVQEAIRHQETAVFTLKEALFTQRIKPLARALHTLYPFEKNKVEDYATARTLQPHLNVVLEQLQPLATDKAEKDSPAHWQAILLADRGDFSLIVSGEASKALECYKKSLAIYLRIYGEEHPDVAMSYNNIGNTYRRLGDLKSALTYHEKSLAITLKIYSEEHPDLATNYNSIGDTHRRLGDAKSALTYHEKSLAIALKIYGEEHPDVATSYNYIGHAHCALGDPKSALTYYEKSLAIRLKIYGEEHPNVATSYNNIGLVQDTLGDPKSALTYYEKSLAIRLKIYGEEHPDVATSYHTIGSAHKALGDSTSALTYYEKSLAIRLKIYGEEHSDVALSFNNIGITHDALEGAKSALAYYEKSLAIYLKIYGEEHPDVARSYNNIGNAHDKLGDAKSALSYYEKSLAIRLKIYSEEHPGVAKSYHSIGLAHKRLGDSKSALTYHEKSLAIRLKIYGKEHPDVARSYHSIGLTHKRLGDSKSTLTYHEKSLAIRLKIYGKEHPDVARSYHSIGHLHYMLGNKKSSRAYYEKALKIYQTFDRQRDVEQIKKILKKLSSDNTKVAVMALTSYPGTVVTNKQSSTTRKGQEKTDTPNKTHENRSSDYIIS